MKRKIAAVLGILQAFVAIGAIPAGFSMIIRQDGSGLGMTTDLLKNSPFPDFLIPGLFLFFINGLLNMAAAILSFMRYKFSGIPGLFLGTALMTWICIQVYYIRLSSFMQPLFFCIGLAEIALSFIVIKINRKSGKFKGTDKIEVSPGNQLFSL
jgi:hypothetical protein